MSIGKGFTTTRSYIETYKGFDIIKEKTTFYCRSHITYKYDTCLIDRIVTKYRCCKEGDRTKRMGCIKFIYEDKIAEVKEKIDKIIAKEENYDVIVTDAEYKRNVTDKDRENQYYMSYDLIKKFIKEYKKGDKVKRFYILERLENCNFHTFWALFKEEKYDYIDELAAREFPFNIDFCLSIETKRKPLKYDEKMLEEIKTAVEEIVNKHSNEEIKEITLVKERIQ